MCVATLPYAYWLHLNGQLDGTIDGVGSESLYFFSPHHEINEAPRDFANTNAASKEIPNMWIHAPRLNTERWIPPPLREHYLPRAITFSKPTVVVYNRYNKEWDRPPINYFDLTTLRKLFTMLLPKYEVVYFNVRGREELEDNAHSMDLGDYEMIRKKFPKVRIIHDLVEQYGGDYNEVQLRVFAGCQKFITQNGGPSILASYFGGENIIYSRECRELWPTVNSFYNWYPHLGGSHIRVVQTHEDLIAKVRSAWVDQEPLLNILVRCHNRPKGLQRLLDSIDVQGYHNVRVIASYDNQSTWNYLLRAPVEKISVSPSPPRPSMGGEDHRGPLPANEYLNALMDQVTSGWVLFIDDDDLYEEGAFSTIIPLLREDRMLLWRMRDRTGWIAPDDKHYGTITPAQISGTAVCFHCSHKDKARWTPWRRGDYRFIRDLSRHVKPIYLDEVLTMAGERLDGVKLDLGKIKRERVMKAEEINAAVRLKKEMREQAAAALLAGPSDTAQVA